MIGTEKIVLNNRKDVKKITHHVLCYYHMLNLVKMLHRKAWSNKDYKITNLMINARVLRAFCCNQEGGKFKEKVDLLKEYFREEPIYKQLQEYYKNNCNEKIFYYVLKDWIKDVENQLEAKTYKFPKQKPLTKVKNFAFNIDDSKYFINVKNNRLILKFGKDDKQYLNIFINYKNLSEHTLRLFSSLKVVYSLGHVEIHFHYNEKKHCNKNYFKPLVKVNNKPEKLAGLDLGLRNIFTLFIDDEDTESLSFDGKELIRYNCEKNYRISKLQKELIERGISKYETVEREYEEVKDGVTTLKTETIKYPVYNEYSKHIRKKIQDTFYWRNHWFDDVFSKMSKRILEYCKKNNVTKLVISRNLGFVKTEGNIEMKKKDKQKFYQIPFMRLIHNLKEKCESSYFSDIEIVEIDEAYTSKTSPFACINKILDIVENDKSNLSSKVFKGKRDGEVYYLYDKTGKRVSKSKDSHKFILDADCVGAYNHMRVYERDRGRIFKPSNYSMDKFKYPVSIKSARAFFEKVNRGCVGLSVRDHLYDSYDGLAKRLTKTANKES